MGDQSRYGVLNSPEFIEPFISKYNTERLGGTITDVEYVNGKGVFNEDTSRIVYPPQYGIYSIRFKVENFTSFYLKLSSTRNIEITAGTLGATGFNSPIYYVNGEVNNTVTSGDEVVVVDNVVFDATDIVVDTYDASFDIISMTSNITDYTTQSVGLTMNFSGGICQVDFDDGNGWQSLTNGVEKLSAYTSNASYDIRVRSTRNDLVTKIQCDDSELTGFDFNNIEFINVDFRTYSNSNLTSISNINSSSTFVYFNVSSCDLTGDLDLNSATFSSCDFRIQNNSNLTSISNINSSSTFTYFYVYDCDLTGDLDLNSATFSSCNFRIDNNSNLTSISDINSSSTFTYFYVHNTGVGVINWTDYSNSDGVEIRQDDCALSAAEQNENLYELDNTGWVNGTYQGDGTNAAPDGTSGGFDGVTALANLVIDVWTVTTN